MDDLGGKPTIFGNIHMFLLPWKVLERISDEKLGPGKSSRDLFGVVKTSPFNSLSDLQIGNQKFTAWITWGWCFCCSIFLSLGGFNDFLLIPLLGQTTSLEYIIIEMGWNNQLTTEDAPPQKNGWFDLDIQTPPDRCIKCMCIYIYIYVFNIYIYIHRFMHIHIHTGTCNTSLPTCVEHDKTWFQWHMRWPSVARC